MPKKLESGHQGFSKEYWDKNYAEPEEMDGIANVDMHVAYLKNLLSIEFIEINSLIDFGFGLGHMFKAMLREFNPYKAYGIEPSLYPFKKLEEEGFSEFSKSNIKIENTDILSWCEANKKMKNFDLGICTSVFQYLSDDEINQCLPIMAQRCKYLYFSVPTDKELKRQVSDLEFHDKYAIRRSQKVYRDMIAPHFTIVSSRVLESKIHFNEQNSCFTDLLFRF